MGAQYCNTLDVILPFWFVNIFIACEISLIYNSVIYFALVSLIVVCIIIENLISLTCGIISYHTFSCSLIVSPVTPKFVCCIYIVGTIPLYCNEVVVDWICELAFCVLQFTVETYCLLMVCVYLNYHAVLQSTEISMKGIF